MGENFATQRATKVAAGGFPVAVSCHHAIELTALPCLLDYAGGIFGVQFVQVTNMLALASNVILSMQKSLKKVLTTKRASTTLRRMPLNMKRPTRQSRLKNKVLKRESLSFVKHYQRFFIQPPPMPWQQDEDIMPFEQPSPLKWVPSETTYGIGTL
jgi:hypothetical protein